MTLEQLRKICISFPSATEDIKWENHLCFNIGKKMFLISSPDEVPVSCSFKVSDKDFEELIQRDGILPAPYLARYKWVHVDDINRLTEKEWESLIEKSYTLIRSKLPKKIRLTLETKY